MRITSERERDLAGYFWANDSRILYLKDTGGDENFQLYGVDIDGTDPKAYTAVPGVRTTIIDPLEEIDSLMIIGTNERNPQIFDPYRLNLNTGEKTLLCENPGDVQGCRPTTTASCAWPTPSSTASTPRSATARAKPKSSAPC